MINKNTIKNENEGDINTQNDYNSLNDSNSQNDIDNESDDFLKEIERFEQQEKEKLENSIKFKKRKYDEDIIIKVQKPPIIGYHPPAQQIEAIRRIKKKIENYKKGIVTRKPRKRFFNKNPESEQKSIRNSFSKKKKLKYKSLSKTNINAEKRFNSFSNINKQGSNGRILVHFKSENKMRKYSFVSENK